MRVLVEQSLWNRACGTELVEQSRTECGLIPSLFSKTTLTLDIF